MDDEKEISFDMIGNMSDDDYKEIDNKDDKNKEDFSDDFNPEEIFKDDNDDENQDEDKDEDGENQEGVADKGKKADNPERDDNGTSPNIYASIANSLKTDGVLTLEDSDFKDIKDANDLATVFSKQVDKLVNERFDESQKRIKEAIDNDMSVDAIKYFENSFNNVNQITDEVLKDESEDSSRLRANVIYQDFINKGLSEDKAKRLTQKSFESGTDIEDSMEAIKEIKTFLQTNYNKAISDKKAEKDALLNAEKDRSKQIENKIKLTEEPIKGIKLSQNDRNKILTQYTTTVAKSDDNKPLNALAKYAKENPIDYQYNLNLLFHLTNGFKDIGNVVQKQVKTAKKSALSDIERIIRNPANVVGTGFNFDNDKNPESKSGVEVSFD